MKLRTENSAPECSQVIPTTDGYTYCTTGAPVWFYGTITLCETHGESAE